MQFSFQNVESSPFWKFHPDIQQICQPLFDHFGISYFDYSRFYPDSSCISLSSNPHYLRYLVNREEYFCAAGRLLPGKHLWHQYMESDFREKTQQDYDYFYGVTYIKHKDEYVEEINFGVSKDYTHILSLYGEKDEMLEYFIAHFLYLITPFLQQNKHSRIILPMDFIQKSESPEEKMDEFPEFIHALHQQSHLRKNTFLIQLDNQLLSLTQREIQCLSYLKNGLSAKLIARQMNISPRTVEIFVTNILNKLGFASRLQLLASFNPVSAMMVDKLASIS